MSAGLEDLRLVVLPVGPDGRAGPPLTLFARTVAKDCEGKDFAAAVLPGKAEGERNELREWLRLAFERPDLEWEAIEELNPFPEVVLEGKTFEARYSPVREEGEISSLLFVGFEPRPRETDEGEGLRKSLARAAEMARLDPNIFSTFLGEATLSLKGCAGAAREEAARALHTMAGNARSFGLSWVARAAREAESAVVEGGEVSGKVEELRVLLAEADDIFRVVTNARDMGDLRGRSAELSVRVLLGRLDALVTLIDGARALVREDEAEAVLSRARELADLARNVPVRSFFARFPGMVHDLAEGLGRRVRFKLEGGEIEVNARLLDRLGDALVHLLRNSVEHGVEPPGERRAHGKPEEGAVTLTFAREEGSLLLSVSDDGRGIDVRELTEKARAAGIEPPADPLELLFLPGFSRKISSPAGVGLDAVKETVETLDGKVSIETRPGRGTTVRLALPKAEA